MSRACYEGAFTTELTPWTALVTARATITFAKILNFKSCALSQTNPVALLELAEMPVRIVCCYSLLQW